jgi:hypothetical protein
MRIKNTEDMRSFLENQIKEKYSKKEEMKKNDKQYLNQIQNSLEKFNLDNYSKEQKKKDELMKYKLDLEKQIREKNSPLEKIKW